MPCVVQGTLGQQQVDLRQEDLGPQRTGPDPLDRLPHPVEGVASPGHVALVDPRTQQQGERATAAEPVLRVELPQQPGREPLGRPRVAVVESELGLAEHGERMPLHLGEELRRFLRAPLPRRSSARCTVASIAIAGRRAVRLSTAVRISASAPGQSPDSTSTAAYSIWHRWRSEW